MKLKFSYAECTIVSSSRTVCPLCQVTVQPRTKHTCSRKNGQAPRRRSKKGGK